jgi:hypothetical protein
MTNRQLTVLTGSSAAGLGGLIDRLGAEGVDIRAHCLVDNGNGNCKLRMIVSEPDRALQILDEVSIAAVVNEVVIVETDDKPGGLSRLLTGFAQEDIQIEYSYTAASDRPGVAVMVFRFSDNARAAGILENSGIKLLRVED